MASAKRKNAHAISKKERMKQMGYTDADPRCGNCTNMRVNVEWVNVSAKQFRRTIICISGGFPVSPTGCCNEWKSKAGEVLDTALPPKSQSAATQKESA